MTSGWVGGALVEICCKSGPIGVLCCESVFSWDGVVRGLGRFGSWRCLLDPVCSEVSKV